MTIYNLAGLCGELAAYHKDEAALALARRIPQLGSDSPVMLTAPNGEGPAPKLVNVGAFGERAEVRHHGGDLLQDCPVFARVNM